jgi:toxin YoeB
MEKNWLDTAWDDYLHWQKHDKTKVKKIHALLKDIERNPFDKNGLGSPEILSRNLRGWMSRHIDLENRLVYRITGGRIDIMFCRGHYE